MIVGQLEHSLRFPFFGSGMNTALHQYFVHSPFVNISLHILHKISTPSSPAAFHSSMGISSIPGAFPFPIFPSTHSTSDSVVEVLARSHFFGLDDCCQRLHPGFYTGFHNTLPIFSGYPHSLKTIPSVSLMTSVLADLFPVTPYSILKALFELVLSFSISRQLFSMQAFLSYRTLLVNSLLSLSHRPLSPVTFACLLSSATPSVSFVSHGCCGFFLSLICFFAAVFTTSFASTHGGKLDLLCDPVILRYCLCVVAHRHARSFLLSELNI